MPGSTPLWRAIVCAVLLLAACLSPRAAWAAPWTIGPRPSWVVPVDIPKPKGAATDAQSGGVRVLLAESQHRAVGKSLEAYHRFANEIANEAGLTAMSSLSVEVDPSYETLVLHAVRVRRGDVAGSRLSRERVRVMQREPGLDEQVVDGVLTVAMFVEDLRVGDVVEWEYTLRGADPTLGGKIDLRLHFGAAAAIGRIHARLLVDESHAVRFQASSPDGAGEKYQPRTSTEGKLSVFAWDFADVPASRPQPESPPWLYSQPSVQISDTASWAEVAALSTSQFRPALGPSASVRAWVKQARSAHPDDDDLTLHAIRFVQDEVRYVGLEEGLGRRHPTPPATVLTRRFGDCKDKSALLVALLTEAGIEAHPALVSTTRGRALADWLPSLAVFDHAIVQVKAKSGKVYWVDATVRLQGGDLERLRYGELDRALVLGVEAKDFAPMEHPPAAATLVTGVDRYDLPAPTSKDKTRIDVERVYRGSLADSFRLGLAAAGSEEISKRFAEAYRAHYPDTSVAANADIRDDRAGDTFTMTVHLAAPSAWTASTDGSGHTFTASAHLVDTNLPSLAPDESPRVAPFLVDGPLEARHRIEVAMPFDVSVTPAKNTTTGQGFELITESSITGRKVVYEHRLSTRHTLVPPSAGDAVREEVRTAREAVVHTLGNVTGDAALTAASGPVGAYLIFVLAIALPLASWVAARVYLHDPEGRVPPRDEQLTLGGWLLLLAFGLLGGSLNLGAHMIGLLQALAPAASWDPYFAAGTAFYSPAFAAWMGIETIIEVCRIAYVAALLLLFFARRRTFPLHFVRYGIFTIAYLWVDHFATDALMPKGLVPQEQGEGYVLRLFGSTFWLAVWITYMRSSDRARRTFVHGRRLPPLASPETAPLVAAAVADEPARTFAPSPAPTHEVDDVDDDHRREV